MKRFTIVSVAASLLLGVCVFLTGCGSSADTSNKMSSGDNMMSSDKMGEDKMGMDKMADDKMGADKMDSDKMSDEKMSDEKMSTN
jgi:pentapeptide MXKDX repeat protein